MSNAGYNPYQAPQSPRGPIVAQIVAGDDVWQDGRILVLRKGAVLPDRCVKCNAPAEGYRLKRTLYWHPWPIYLTIFLGVLIYFIIALVVRQTMVTHIGLCPRHRSRRLTGIAIAWLMVVGSIGGFILAASAQGPTAWTIAVASAVILVLSPFVGLFTASTVSPWKIDTYFGWLRGVCPDYLAELPPSPVRL